MMVCHELPWLAESFCHFLSRLVGTATTQISRLLRLRVQLCRTSLWSYLVKIWWVVEDCCCWCCFLTSTNIFGHWGTTFMLQVHSCIWHKPSQTMPLVMQAGLKRRFIVLYLVTDVTWGFRSSKRTNSSSQACHWLQWHCHLRTEQIQVGQNHTRLVSAETKCVLPTWQASPTLECFGLQF